MPQAKRESEISADHRPAFSYLEKSQAISIMYEFAILFCVARHLPADVRHQAHQRALIASDSVVK